MSCCFDFYFFPRSLPGCRPCESRDPVPLHLSSTSLSFSAPLPGARVTFSCVAKRKSPKRRPPREHVLSTSVCSGCASGRRGSPKAHPCACGELAHILCAILRTDPASARRVRGAPFTHLLCAGQDEAERCFPLRTRPWMAVIEVQTAPLHDAAVHSRSREQGAHVRAQGCASSRRRAIGEHQGKSSRHDVGEIVMPGAVVLVTFAETKVTRAHGMRAEPRQGCRCVAIKDRCARSQRTTADAR